MATYAGRPTTGNGFSNNFAGNYPLAPNNGPARFPPNNFGGTYSSPTNNDFDNFNNNDRYRVQQPTNYGDEAGDEIEETDEILPNASGRFANLTNTRNGSTSPGILRSPTQRTPASTRVSFSENPQIREFDKSEPSGNVFPIKQTNATPESIQAAVNDMLLENDIQETVIANNRLKEFSNLKSDIAHSASVDQIQSPKRISSGIVTSNNHFATPIPCDIVLGARTVENLAVFPCKPRQLVPPESYQVRILSVQYTVIRLVGYTESATLEKMIEEHRSQYPSGTDEWRKVPIDIPLVACSKTGLEDLAYSDALFLAFVYKVTSVNQLNQDYLSCFLDNAVSNRLSLYANKILQRMTSLVNPSDLATYQAFLNQTQKYFEYIRGNGVTEARISQVVQCVTASMIKNHGFSVVALAMLSSPDDVSVLTIPFSSSASTSSSIITTKNNDWVSGLMYSLGAALAAVTGLGSETVTGALVETLMRPLTESPYSKQKAIDLVSQVSEYLTTIRARQENLVIDRGISERLFYAVYNAGSLDVEIVRDDACSSGTRYQGLTVVSVSEIGQCTPYTPPPSPQPSNPNLGLLCKQIRSSGLDFKYANRLDTGCASVDANNGTASKNTIETVGGIQTLLDGWTSLIVRPKCAYDGVRLRQIFAPIPILSSLLSPLPCETPFAFRVDRNQIFHALTSDPSLYFWFKTMGILEGSTLLTRG
jgi:hypothetical protein